MSTNMRIQKICLHCRREFIARTTVTKYCGELCAARAYKERKRAEKIESASEEVLIPVNGSPLQTKADELKPVKEFQKIEYLTIAESCKLLSISRWTLWRAIKAQVIKTGNVGRRILIKRDSLDSLFEKKQPLILQAEPVQYDVSECYTLTEIQDKYRISNAGLYSLIKRNNVPKLKVWRSIYVPKTIIDNLLSGATAN